MINLTVLTELSLCCEPFHKSFELLARHCTSLSKLALNGTKHEGFFAEIAAFCRSCPSVYHLAIGLNLKDGLGLQLFGEDLGANIRHIVLKLSNPDHSIISLDQYSTDKPLTLTKAPHWFSCLIKFTGIFPIAELLSSLCPNLDSIECEYAQYETVLNLKRLATQLYARKQPIKYLTLDCRDMSEVDISPLLLTPCTKKLSITLNIPLPVCDATIGGDGSKHLHDFSLSNNDEQFTSTDLLSLRKFYPDTLQTLTLQGLNGMEFNKDNSSLLLIFPCRNLRS